jgi:hypothetical protein
MAQELNSADVPKANPSVDMNKVVAGNRKRIPMSVPLQRLEVPEIPGYHLHWFLEKNIPRALQAAYEFVSSDEVPVNQMGVGTHGSISGSADLGSRVTVHSGVSELAKPEYLTLMKLKNEFWEEDRKAIDAKNAGLMSGIFRDEQIQDSPNNPVSGQDQDLRYVKTARTSAPVFNRPTRKARIAK